MPETMFTALSNIRTAEDMIVAFRDEEQCRRLLEGMVWPDGTKNAAFINQRQQTLVTFIRIVVIRALVARMGAGRGATHPHRPCRIPQLPSDSVPC